MFLTVFNNSIRVFDDDDGVRACVRARVCVFVLWARGGVKLYLCFLQFLPLWNDEKLDSVHGTVQGCSSYKQNEQDHVGEGCSEVHNLHTTVHHHITLCVCVCVCVCVRA